MNKQGKPGGIEWTDYTWSPITGCLGPDGIHPCPYCYAKRLAEGRLRHLYTGSGHAIPGHDPQQPFTPRLWPERIEEPLSVKKPAKIFVCNMGELFGDWIPEGWQERVFDTIRRCPQHTFQLLTKQEQNLFRFSPFPPNCWVGISIEGNDLGRPIYFLNQIKATVKFISFEPFLYPVTQIDLLRYLDWIIIGGKSGKAKFYPPEEWIQGIEQQADQEGIPVFEKYNLRKQWLKLPRQELP